MNDRIIYQTSEGGVAVVIPSGELPIDQVLAKDVPDAAKATAEIVTVNDIPSDRTFRGAWIKNGKAIGHDMNKAKEIAHEKRRAARAKEFEPLDNIIAKQIPGNNAQQAETARQAIRDKYAAMQAEMDAATTVEELKALLPQD
jgi:hypothetical protein